MKRIFKCRNANKIIIHVSREDPYTSPVTVAEKSLIEITDGNYNITVMSASIENSSENKKTKKNQKNSKLSNKATSNVLAPSQPL